MTSIRHQNFRSFLTERFTSAAVDIFGEVEAIVEAYYEENKRLRDILHMVVNPEIKIPRIDDIQHTGISTGIGHGPSEQTGSVSMAISNPLPLNPKEEQIEYDIGQGSTNRQVLEEADNLIISDWVKNDPDAEDLNMQSTDSYHVQEVEVNQESSATISVDEGNNDDPLSSPDSDDYQQLSMSEESSSESVESQKHNKKKRIEKRRSLQKTVLEMPRMMPYKSLIPTPADCHSFLARLTEAYKDFPDDQKPLITKMGLTENFESVDCAFGKVPKGSPLSYQCPLPSSKDYQIHDDAPPRPKLPLLSPHMLDPMTDCPTLSAKELEHLTVLQINLDAAQSLESSTRPPHGHKELAEELRKLRLTSRFWEICKLKAGQSNVEHLIFKIRNGTRRSKTAQIDEEMKTEALREYCRNVCVNWSPCGLVIHPHAPWLGSQPDGLVYDPKEKPKFGLVHVKVIQSRSFIDGNFLVCNYGVLQLKKTHSLYWQIQGEMMVAGMSWCDLLAVSNEDILVQRIYRDKAIINIMKKKLNDFFFYYYLPSLL
nr:uncharacterized protein LOC109993799 [Labrus bergylta]